jgi:hypothetical protein
MDDGDGHGWCGVLAGRVCPCLWVTTLEELLDMLLEPFHFERRLSFDQVAQEADIWWVMDWIFDLLP